MRMETPQQRCARLTKALGDLADQEAACVRAGDFDSVASLQQRAAAIVQDLTTNGVLAADNQTRRQLASIVERREKTAAEIQAHLLRTQERLDQLDANRRRVSKIAPVYGRGVAQHRKLAFTG